MTMGRMTRTRETFGGVDDDLWTRTRARSGRTTRGMIARATEGEDGGWGEDGARATRRARAKTWALVGGAATVMTLAIGALYLADADKMMYGIDSVESYAASYDGEGFDFDFDRAGGGAISGAGAAGAVVWAVGLFYASPISVIMLFLGRTDSERPSDWVLRKVTGVRALEDAEAAQRAGVAAWFFLSGCLATVVGDKLLGDSSWGISAGIGFLCIAAVSELGRPRRVDEATLRRMESQFADFCAFADERLSRSGRVHQSEISKAFRTAYPEYKSENVLPESEFRTLVANYAVWAERSPRGYYKNLSLRPLAPRASVRDLGL